MSRGAMRWIGLCVPLLLLAGCPSAGSPDTLLLDERFEDGLANWTVSGSVTTVATIHPAEHGLQVLAPTTMTRAFTYQIWGEFQDGLWLEYSTDCGGSPEVWVEQQPDLTYHVVASLPTESAGESGEFD